LAHQSRKILKFWWSLPLLVILGGIYFIFRYPTDTDTLKVFFHARPNVFELLNTLDHFRNDPDPKKYEATKFLIRNMDLHYYREDEFSDKKIKVLTEYFDSIESGLQKIKDSLELVFSMAGENYEIVKKEWFAMYNASVYYQIQKIDDSLDQVWADGKENSPVKKIRDARGIKATFLIAHIDKAFELWEKSPWNQHFSFQQFCEYFLPYKTNESPPELWLEHYRKNYGQVIESSGGPADIQELIFRLISEARTRYGYYQPDIRRHRSSLEMDQTPTGDCRYLSEWEGMIFRSMGLPVANINSIWAYAGEGHFWNAWMDKDGAWREIMPRGDSIIRWEATPPKIFARHWGKQENSLRTVAAKHKIKIQDIPEHLQAWNLVDITGDIIPASNITVAVDQTHWDPNNQLVYLAVNDDGAWIPLHWAFIENNQAIFSQMGRNMLYFPVFHYNGRLKQAGDAFIITDDEKIYSIKPDTSQYLEFRIDRIYPLRQWVMHKHADQMINGTFEGSNDREFRESDTLHQIVIRFRSRPSLSEAPKLKGRWTYDMWWQEKQVNAGHAYRYIRYRSGNDMPCAIGDMEVYGESGNKLVAHSFFGSDGNPEYLSDGVPGQYFLSGKAGSWAAMDLGAPERITKIRFIPHDIDPASIQLGDDYRLYIWDKNNWKAVSDVHAYEKSIPIQIHPWGLYLLENLSTFVHRRPFWYNPDKGIIEWW